MFAAKMIELDEKLRHLHERIDDGEHEDITALMCELNALTEEYNLEQDAIRYRLKECKVPKIQALISKMCIRDRSFSSRFFLVAFLLPLKILYPISMPCFSKCSSRSESLRNVSVDCAD